MAASAAFICAMPLEMRPLVKRLSLRRHQGIWEGSVGARPVVATVTGMGTRLAADKTEALLGGTSVERVIVFGITGAIGPDTPIGALILPEMVVNSATGAEFRPERIGPGQRGGTMWTTDVLLTDVDVLAGLRSRGVVSLDMETAAIAEVSERQGIPWSVFRVISDRADDGSVDAELFALSNQDGSPNPKAIARYVARHPGALPRMARMGRNVKRATEAAVDAAVAAFTET